MMWLACSSIAREAASPDFFQGQRCKRCGRRDKFDFNVPDGIWATVVPPHYRDHVLCLACFDDLASQKKQRYILGIDTLYFAGDAASLVFKVKGNGEP